MTAPRTPPRTDPREAEAREVVWLAILNQRNNDTDGTRNVTLAALDAYAEAVRSPAAEEVRALQVVLDQHDAEREVAIAAAVRAAAAPPVEARTDEVTGEQAEAGDWNMSPGRMRHLARECSESLERLHNNTPIVVPQTLAACHNILRAIADRDEAAPPVEAAQREADARWCDAQQRAFTNKAARYRAAFDAEMPPDETTAIYTRLAGYARTSPAAPRDPDSPISSIDGDNR